MSLIDSDGEEGAGVGGGFGWERDAGGKRRV